ncbi:MAG: DMT family transporter [Rhodospirillales bacterium]|nr:DMT family transporter [Alphaproteobacteria bacterium]MBL6948827.1 DMT family transporter [Rhodospirillales bacterium]
MAPETDTGDSKQSLWHRYAWVAYLAVFIGVLGHASSEFVSKVISANAAISGPEVSVWRFFLGGLGLVVVSLLIPASRNLAQPIRKHGMALVLFSVFGLAGAYLFFHWSLDYATVPQVATVVTTAPIFVGLINLYANKVPIGAAKIISGLGAVTGVAFLVTDGALLALAGDASNLIGIFMAIMCALLMSVYLVLIKPYIAEFGALRITAITLFLGGLALWLGVGLLFGRWVAFWTIGSLATPAIIAITVLVLYNTTLTQWLWIGGLAAVPDITRGTYLFFLKPVLAAGLAVLFLDTRLSLWQVLAIGVICSAVAAEALIGHYQSKKESTS